MTGVQTCALPILTVSAAITGILGAFHGLGSAALGNSGEPLGAFIAAYIAIEIGMLISQKTSFSLILTPFASILSGALVGYFATPYITRFIYWIVGLASYNVAASPIIGGIVVAVLFSLFAVMPLNLPALAMSLGLSGEIGRAHV